MTEPLELETWTSCEVHGHAFVRSVDREGRRMNRCTDCGDDYEVSVDPELTECEMHGCLWVTSELPEGAVLHRCSRCGDGVVVAE